MTHSEESIVTVNELEERKILLVQDGNHGEYRPLPHEFVSPGVAFIRAADMANGRVLFESAEQITETARARIRKGVGQPGDILLSHKGTVGKLARVSADAPPFVCSPQTTFWRILDTSVIDPGFLYCFMNSSEFRRQLDSRKGETDMADYVSLTAQRELTLRLPPIEKQRAIAGVLNSLDDKIELNRKTNETLEQMARTIFRSWFIDYDPVRAKQQGKKPFGMDDATAALFPDSFEQSEFGEIPKGWKVSKLDEVVAYLSRGIGPSYVENGGIRVFNQKCVREGVVSVAQARRHDPSKRSTEGRLLREKDILVNSTGTGTLGRVGQIWHIEEPSIVDSHVTIVRGDPTKMSSCLLGIDLRMRESEIESLAEGSTGQTELSKSRLGGLTVMVAPKKIQEAADYQLKPIISLIHNNLMENVALSQTRDLLLPRLLSGELTIKEVSS